MLKTAVGIQPPSMIEGLKGEVKSETIKANSHIQDWTAALPLQSDTVHHSRPTALYVGPSDVTDVLGQSVDDDVCLEVVRLYPATTRTLSKRPESSCVCVNWPSRYGGRGC